MYIRKSILPSIAIPPLPAILWVSTKVDIRNNPVTAQDLHLYNAIAIKQRAVSCFKSVILI